MTGIRIPMTSSIPPCPIIPFGPLIITMPLRVIKIKQTAKASAKPSPPFAGIKMKLHHRGDERTALQSFIHRIVRPGVNHQAGASFQENFYPIRFRVIIFGEILRFVQRFQQCQNHLVIHLVFCQTSPLLPYTLSA